MTQECPCCDSDKVDSHKGEDGKRYLHCRNCKSRSYEGPQWRRAAIGKAALAVDPNATPERVQLALRTLEAVEWMQREAGDVGFFADGAVTIDLNIDGTIYDGPTFLQAVEAARGKTE